MSKKFVFIVLIFSLLPSCIVSNFTGLKSGYKQLSAEEKAKIITLEENVSIEELVGHETIYSISSQLIENFLKSWQGDLVVYTWGPNCSSSVCYSLEYVQELCTQRNQKLIVITEYFDMSQIESQRLDRLDFPLFSVNTDFYRTDFCNKYMERFLVDLLNVKKIPKEVLFNRYLLFSNGKFVKTINDIRED